MTDETARSLALITKKLGFTPWGGCDECQNLAYCHRRERELPTLPCELDDREAQIDVYKPPRQNAWDRLRRAA